MDSSLALTGARQHCVAKILMYITPTKEPTQFMCVVSALQSVVLIHFFLADQPRSLVDPTLAALIVCGLLQLFRLTNLFPHD